MSSKNGKVAKRKGTKRVAKDDKLEEEKIMKSGPDKKNKKKKYDDEYNNDDDDDDFEDVDEEEEGIDDTAAVEPDGSEDDVSESESSDANSVVSREFPPRSFVVLRSDFERDSDDYPLWKIDGSSLIQKYEPFRDESGDMLFKSTPVYSGWSLKIKDSYYHAPTVFIRMQDGNSIVEFKKDLVQRKSETVEEG